MRYFTPNPVILDVTLKMPVTPVILLYNLYSLRPACWTGNAEYNGSLPLGAPWLYHNHNDQR